MVEKNENAYKSERKPTCVNVVAMDRLIDYLLTSPEDFCGKCVYYREDEEVTCNSACKDCKQGMLAYFANGGK